MAEETIRDGMVVSLAYSLTADGEIVETATAAEPLDYLHGADNIVPGLEAALVGKKVGDRLSVTLQPAEAYGEYDPEDNETVPLADFPDSNELAEGMAVVMEDEDGYMFDALIREIRADEVVLDFNPPLAGRIITYDVEVMEIRQADEEELAAGQPYGFMDDDFEDDDEVYDEDEAYEE